MDRIDAGKFEDGRQVFARDHVDPCIVERSPDAREVRRESEADIPQSAVPAEEKSVATTPLRAAHGTIEFGALQQVPETLEGLAWTHDRDRHASDADRDADQAVDPQENLKRGKDGQREPDLRVDDPGEGKKIPAEASGRKPAFSHENTALQLIG